MNREKAKANFLLGGRGASAHVIIDELCDDFESRVCPNCKHGIIPCAYQEGIEAYARITRGRNYVCDFKDFGCNRFEGKEDG